MFAGDDPKAIINPEIVESDGEWEFDEGCLSVPGLSWNIVRPKTVHLIGRDLDGNELSIEADELEARVFQHELDHLNGVLLIERLDDETGFASTLGILVSANNVFDQDVIDLIYGFTIDAEERDEVVATSSLVGTMEKIIDIDGATPLAPTSR